MKQLSLFPNKPSYTPPRYPSYRTATALILSDIEYASAVKGSPHRLAFVWKNLIDYRTNHPVAWERACEIWEGLTSENLAKTPLSEW